MPMGSSHISISEDCSGCARAHYREACFDSLFDVNTLSRLRIYQLDYNNTPFLSFNPVLESRPANFYHTSVFARSYDE